MTIAIMRANNPAALRPHPGEGWLHNNGIITLPGGDYQSFTSMAWGIRAALRNLHTYRTKHKLHTPRGIINRWAPQHDNNPTPAYVDNVARRCGVGPDEPIPFTYRGTWKLIAAIMHQETGGAHIPDFHIAAAFRIMRKEEAGRGVKGDPEVYTAPIDVAPIQRARQEAEKVGRRGWSAITGAILSALYAARDGLYEIGIMPAEALVWVRAQLGGVAEWSPVLVQAAAIAAAAVVGIMVFKFLSKQEETPHGLGNESAGGIEPSDNGGDGGGSDDAHEAAGRGGAARKRPRRSRARPDAGWTRSAFGG